MLYQEFYRPPPPKAKDIVSLDEEEIKRYVVKVLESICI